MAKHGEITWNELNTWEPDAARAFYERTLGWRWESMPMPDGSGAYWLAKNGEQMVAGLFALTSPAFDGAPSSWLTYFEVSDADAAAAETTAAGGTVLRAPFDIAGVGRIAIVQDPTGAVLGVMTSVPMGDSGQPG